MKALWQDLAKKTGTLIESLYEVAQYPAANVAHNFLNKWFISSLQYDTITTTFAAPERVDCIFIAGCNCAAGSYVLRDSAGVPVAAGNLTLTRTVQSFYLSSPVTAKSLELTFDLSLSGLAPYVDPAKDQGTNLKIKGVGVGCACSLPEKILSGLNLPQESKSLVTSSRGGQYLSAQYPALRKVPLDLAALTWEEVETLRAGVALAGYGKPTFFDLFEGTQDYEPPIYAVILDPLEPTRHGNTYNLRLTLEEAR